ncbi:MAG TPA: MFS transporter, partial [Ilumatobacteraceae bacterium]|nr:MFS transporter [Ilumatobacteraceae bacterium]
ITFGLCYAVGGGGIGALGFYHVTQAAAMRSAPGDPARAVRRLTMLGAFSSPIFLPLTAWLVQSTTWRTTVMIEAVLASASFVVAALVVPDHRVGFRATGRSRDAFAHAWRSQLFRRLLVATLLSGIAADIMLAFQVPIMRDAGLPLATAAFIAGLRGLSQLLGRVPLGAILRRVPARRALAAAQAAAAVAALLLLASGSLVAAVAFGLVAGAATGASSPLQGIHTAELVPTAHLGLLLGVQQALYGVAGAAGPIMAGVLLSTTGSWVPAIVLTAVGFLGAAVLLRHQRKGPTTACPDTG